MVFNHRRSLDQELDIQSHSMNLSKPDSTNKKFLSVIEVASKEYAIDNPDLKLSTQNLDSYLSLKQFLNFNDDLKKNSNKNVNDGRFIIRNFEMFDTRTLEPLHKDQYLKKVHCNPLDDKQITQAAYKLL